MLSLRCAASLLLTLVLASALGAQSPRPPAPAATDSARLARLGAILDIDEPGQQMRALEAFAREYPKAPELKQVYRAILQDAIQLSDDRTILTYNEKLEALDPADLSQWVKTLNLLLLETDAADRAAATRQAAAFARLVEAKAKEAPPKQMGEATYRLDMARLRALAGLFQGTAAAHVGDYAAAERELAASLQQSQTEEAAAELAKVFVAENKLPQAVDSYALALALPGDTIAERAKLEAAGAKLYRSLHGGHLAGFGDLILRRFNDVAARDAATQAALDPPGSARNAAADVPRQFVLTDLRGGTHTLGAAAGKVAVVDFWATWCGPCLVQHPLLGALRREFANNHDVMFISVNEDQDRDKVAPFLAEHHWSRSTWLDAGLGPFLGIDSLPTTLLLSPSGHVVYRASGFVPATFEADLRAAILGALRRAGLPAAP
jgi:thiol-disulfide isomerase/thioredoxin